MLKKALMCAWLLTIPVFVSAGELLYPEGIKYFNQALSEQRSGKLDKALNDYQNAMLVMGPQALVFKKYVLNNTGVMAAVRGDVEQAEAMFQEALEIDPKYKLAAYNLGLMYVRQGNNSAAIRVWATTFDFPKDYTLEGEKESEEKSVF